MVDPVGAKPVSIATRRTAPVGSTPGTAPVRTAVDHATREPSSLTATAAEMAARPPVDAERVARLRQAVADGTYRIKPEAIANGMIAMKVEWSLK